MCHTSLFLLLQAVSVELQTPRWSPEDWSYDGGIRLQVLPVQSWRLPVHRYTKHTQTAADVWVRLSQTEQIPRVSRAIPGSDHCFQRPSLDNWSGLDLCKLVNKHRLFSYAPSKFGETSSPQLAASSVIAVWSLLASVTVIMKSITHQ